MLGKANRLKHIGTQHSSGIFSTPLIAQSKKTGLRLDQTKKKRITANPSLILGFLDMSFGLVLGSHHDVK